MSDISTSWASDLHERLKDREYAVGFLEANLEEYERDGDLGAFLVAIRHVAQAQGKIKKLAEEMGVDRSTVYRALSKEGNPTINTLNAALRSLGFKVSVELVPT
jgi:probable addiction module antidote protein